MGDSLDILFDLGMVPLELIPKGQLLKTDIDTLTGEFTPLRFFCYKGTPFFLSAGGG